MVSATNADGLLVSALHVSAGRAAVECGGIERGGVRTIGEVLAEALPRYVRIAEAYGQRDQSTVSL